MKRTASIVVFLSAFSVSFAMAEERYYTTAPKTGDDDDSTRYYAQSLETLQKKTETARKKWVKEKAKHDDSYQYVSTDASWVGFGHSTTIKVVKGVVVERRFEAFDREQKVTESWVETAEELGTHGSGHGARTMDELFEECATITLTQDPEKNRIGVELGKDSQLLSCFWVPIGCADDCSRGFGDLDFEWAR